jgi:hypothetical protein
MSSHTSSANEATLDLSRWRKLPYVLIGVGGIIAILGAIFDIKQFSYSWLLAFMFFLSIGLGGLFLVIVHHLFDASWSVPIRRITENLSIILFPTLLVLFIPVAIFAKDLYPWLGKLFTGSEHIIHGDHALYAKAPLFSIAGFYIVCAANFLVWGFLTRGLRGASLKQDTTGSAEHTHRMRFLASIGAFLFAITLTMASIMWMKSLMHQWFSTMYGVYYFAGSVWTTLATVYLLTAILKSAGPLKNVIHEKQFYFIGTLFFAFTVFYAYIAFSQYFIIWNANMPEETFWYVLREKGSWWHVGMLMIFGHFFLPFLSLLRIDMKLKWWFMVPMALWAWLMHFWDLEFNIMPLIHPEGVSAKGVAVDIGCVLFMAGVVILVFFKNYFAHPPYPQRDPRIAEGLDTYVPPVTDIATAPGRAK